MGVRGGRVIREVVLILKGTSEGKTSVFCIRGDGVSTRVENEL